MLKTKYKYIEFKLASWAGKGTYKKWACYNRKHFDCLGFVEYDNKWHQYIYKPSVQAIYSASCLQNIVEFLETCGIEEA